LRGIRSITAGFARAARKQGRAPAACAGFNDIAGNEEACRSMQEIIDFLKAPQRYVSFGARVPKGVLLYGPPGTGKTLLARAVAGEADVPFFSLSGSDFMQMYVGVGAMRVRELFARGRKAGRAIIFIDEIDAIGKSRHRGADGASDERDQTLNALLTEMDGFSGDSGVIMLAATNRFDVLDPALLRPGRFDRLIEIGLPDQKARQAILQLHAQNKPVSADVCFSAIAEMTLGFSGAQLENLLNEAALQALREGKPRIDQQMIENAFTGLVAGTPREDQRLETDRFRAAVHEAGHAVVSALLLPDHQLKKVTILPTSRGAGGYSLSLPRQEKMVTEKELRAQICTALAGRCAEALFFGADHVSVGAESDLEKATVIAQNMVTRWGMGGAGPVSFRVLDAGGHSTQQLCRALLEELYEQTMALISEYRQQLESIASALMKEETLSGEAVMTKLVPICQKVSESSEGVRA